MSLKHLSLAILIVTSQVFCLEVFADTVKLKGAAKRKNVRQYDRNAIQIDDLVRMEDDLGFADWKAEEERKEALRAKQAEAYKLERERYEASLEAARIQFIQEREQGKKSEAAKEVERIKDFQRHLKEKQARKRSQERARATFAAESQIARERMDASRIARLQKVYGFNRMPAALEDDMSKYPNLRHKKPGHPLAK